MAVTAADIKLYRAATNGDNKNTNGGKRTAAEIVSMEMNNVFPNVSHADRVAGAKFWRKVFLQNINIDNSIATAVKMFIDSITTGEDYYRMFAARYNCLQTEHDGVTMDVLGGYLYTCGAKQGAGTIAIGSLVTVDGEPEKQGIVTAYTPGASICIRILSNTVDADGYGIFQNADSVCLSADHTTYVVLSSEAGERSYHACATGTLQASVTAGENEIVMDFAHDEYIRGHLMPGDTIFISSLENELDATHRMEFLEVEKVEWDGDGLSSCTITTVGMASYSYLTSNVGGTTYPTRVGKVLDIGNLVASFGSFVTSIAGNGVILENAMGAKNRGCKRDTVTITFTSATQFTVTGVNVASYGTGNVNGTFSPLNADFGTPYFTIPPSFWSGTFTAGDYVEFEVYPADIALWLIEIVPTGAAAMSNDITWFMCSLEAA